MWQVLCSRIADIESHLWCRIFDLEVQHCNYGTASLMLHLWLGGTSLQLWYCVIVLELRSWCCIFDSEIQHCNYDYASLFWRWGIAIWYTPLICPCHCEWASLLISLSSSVIVILLTNEWLYHEDKGMLMIMMWHHCLLFGSLACVLHSSRRNFWRKWWSCVDYLITAPRLHLAGISSTCFWDFCMKFATVVKSFSRCMRTHVMSV